MVSTETLESQLKVHTNHFYDQRTQLKQKRNKRAGKQILQSLIHLTPHKQTSNSSTENRHLTASSRSDQNSAEPAEKQ